MMEDGEKGGRGLPWLPSAIGLKMDNGGWKKGRREP